MEKGETVEQTRRRIRINKGIGMINGEEASWIGKSIEEMTPEEYQEYNKLNKRFSRRNMDEDKKDKVRSKDKELKIDQRFARWGYKRNKNNKNEYKPYTFDDETDEERMQRFMKWENKKGHKYPYQLTCDEKNVLSKLIKSSEKEGEKEDSSEDENYYEDYDFEDNERDVVLVGEKVTFEELKADAEDIDEYIKEMKKQKLKKPAPPLPKTEICECEKMRKDNIQERHRAMVNSGLFSKEELRKMEGPGSS